MKSPTSQHTLQGVLYREILKVKHNIVQILMPRICRPRIRPEPRPSLQRLDSDWTPLRAIKVRFQIIPSAGTEAVCVVGGRSIGDA